MTSGKPTFYLRGSREYWKASIALMFAGYANFSILNYVQPLLPDFSSAFNISPSSSSLSLSLTSATLAVAILIAAFVSDHVNRHRIMIISLMASSLLTLPIAFLFDWNDVLILRALVGLTLGGVPAVAMAYLAEEIEPDGLGLSMGLYVSGTALGGMAGRFITGMVTHYLSWRYAVGAIAILSLAATFVCIALLPKSRNFVPRNKFEWRHHRTALAQHLSVSSHLLGLLVVAFTIMGGFVAVYNYLAYRLIQAPFYLSQAAVAFIFIFYLLGVAASPIAGGAVGKWGRKNILVMGIALMIIGVAMTLANQLVVIAIGMGCMTFGFFSSHAVASGWVGRLAMKNKGHATALYLLAYYGGASVVGAFGGQAWTMGGWAGLSALVLALLLIALVTVRWVPDNIRRSE